jgi:cellulose synthase/poly-beta-1,6-N-acetylglucosamine synthase-like glycosyltransferase
MIRLVALGAQAALLGLAAYNGAVALWGWRNRPPAPHRPPETRFRVAIPAHDEAAVIATILNDLTTADYPDHLLDVCVIADRCSDATADIARRAWRVVERSAGEPGKGPALAWYLEQEPLGDGEVLVLFDADNRVPTEFFGRFADEIAAGHQVLQAYLDVSNPDSSPLATAAALSYWAGNRMVQLARTNLGWSADLGGTGMAFTSDALESAGGFGSSLTEDQELGARLALAGIPVVWLHDVRIFDEKPTTMTSTVGQRSRWMAGKRAVATMYLGPLWAGALRHRSLRLFDQGLRLVQPGRSFVAMLSGSAAAASAVTRSPALFPWPVWAVATGAQFLEPIPFLARDGVPPRYLARYPLLALLAALWLPIRVVSSRAGAGWYHTPHGADPKLSRSDSA